MSLIQVIRSDKNYVAFKAAFLKVQATLDLEKVFDEALSLHASRASRSLTGDKRYSPKALIDASLIDMSCRARMVEIRVQTDRKIGELEELLLAIRRHISTEYAEDLKDYSTAEQRKSFVDRALKGANQYVADGSKLIDSLDKLITDTNNASYNIQHAIKCLEILDSSKAGRVV